MECFFGNIRSHGYRDTNPDCYHFISSFKTLLINNFSTIKSAGNCELEDSDGVLNNLKQFITGSHIQKSNEEDTTLLTVPITNDVVKNVTVVTDMNIGYVAGYMARRILKCVKNCKQYKEFLVSKEKTNLLIRSRDFTSNSLIHPNSTYFNVVKEMFNISNIILPTLMENDVGKRLIFLFEINIDIPKCCYNHNLSTILFEKLKNVCLFTLLKNINSFKRIRLQNIFK